MAYDDTSPYPRLPDPAPRPASRHEGWVRFYLLVQLGLGLLLGFYSVLLAASTFLPIIAGRGADAINVLLLATWSIAGLVCATRCIKACWRVLARSSRGEG
ncbi:hypothetical protein J2X45_003367 [Caulobacter sp. BE264]|uniref:hypothetical protein n=1 Tax=Caulobacter sp. BE264 TaxID=2817724 RepID=UPI0028646E1E|nr:hypothetical protein [Caulobacter sp. BE264]MDR7232261.1 hypothetical protein [Caulobacter sp. BE264]